MDVKHYYKAADFLSQSGRFLTKDEARYGLTIGIASMVKENPNRYGAEAPWFCSISADPRPTSRLGAEMHAAALRTPPFMVVLSYFSGSFDAVAEQLVLAAGKKYRELPGVLGDKGLADRFAVRWCGKHGVKVVHTMGQRIYKLTHVNDVPAVPGKIRPASEADTELVKKWSHAFHVDCFGEKSKSPENDISKGIAGGHVFIWEADGKPVSMAAGTRPTEKGMTVGAVYTPPEERKKGYATACVAEVSRRILQSGKQFCTLYTDLANPTSNSIYMKIGYTPIADSVQHEFG